MTLYESIFWSFARSVVIATLAIGPLSWILRHIESLTTIRARRFLLVAAVLPLFVPELLIGFNYRLTATQLSAGSSPIVAAIGTEGLYALIQLARCIAVGVAVSLLLPNSPVTRESLHAWAMLKPVMANTAWRIGWLRLKLTGPWLRLLVSWSLMSLIVFQEFETAALMQIDRHPIAWSVWLFDAHAAYQPLSRSLRMTLLPLCCELLLLAPALWLLTIHRPVTDQVTDKSFIPVEGRGHHHLIAWSCLLPGLIFFAIWPIAANAATALSGLLTMARNGFLLSQSLSEILTSTGFAIAAAFLSMVISSMLQDGPRWARSAKFIQAAMLVPGLLGSLVLSLLLLAMFQTPLARFLYDTWLPMLIGLVLAVLPKAFAVVLLLKHSSDDAAIHSAFLLQQSNFAPARIRAATIRWRLRTARWLLGGLIVSHWCFWDVTVASILHSVRLEPVVTRLYNEMHYGRTEALMSLAMISAVAPALAWLIAIGISWISARAGFFRG